MIYCAFDGGGWKRYRKNLKLIEPYRLGPPLYFTDCVTAVAGMVYRRGLLEFTSSFALMFIINPWVKFWVTGNIYTCDLGERFITQVGGPLDDMTLEQVASSFQTFISSTKNTDENRRYIQSIFFCPHFPYPPRNKRRKFAVGVEHSRIAAFVHTTHFRSNGNTGCDEYLAEKNECQCISRSAKAPIYRVILWRNNPYHIYTGVVEACISKRNQGLEHPMWLISGHNKLAADPKVLLSTGWIDVFFEDFIPHLEYFIRLNELGRMAADAIQLLDED